MSLKDISVFLSLVLRHKPQTIGISLDKHGWVSVIDLLRGINATGRYGQLDKGLLEDIVRKDSKQRYSFSKDGKRIRANQGHSICVDVELEIKVPPVALYHGTGEKYVDSIEKNGLLPQNRLYVHLSRDVETARKVGSRHGKPVVYHVNTEMMQNDGFLFFESVNCVWLTKFVPVQYLRKECEKTNK
jgi:putative RNA 2'-phosphotransferase